MQPRSKVTVITLSGLPTVRQPIVVLPKQRRIPLQEAGTVAVLLALSLLVRLYAAFHSGIEVDEPIYRDAAALALRYGYPMIRPAYLHPAIPFLYHPPFYLWILAGWFKLWGQTDYLTGRMCSVFISLLLLLSIYLFVRSVSSKKTAFIALLLIACDPWIIFTNQAIYLENSLALFSLFAVWAYWRATQVPTGERVSQLRWYAFAGLLAGWSIIYKQIGGYIALVFLLNLLLQRRHWIGHALLFGSMAILPLCYAWYMHRAFGALYDAATLDQVHRTIGMKAAPGLNDSFTQALRTAWSQYWMFLVTIVMLLGGSILVSVCYVRRLLHRSSDPYHSIIVSWALGGIIFALAISLKSPHYLILWLVPLYIFFAHEIMQKWENRSRAKWKIQIGRVILSLLLVVGACVGDIWGFQNRFTHPVGDTLLQSEAYIDETLPPDAIVLTQNYIGVDIVPPFLDITLIDTPQLVLQKGVTYMALYWSSTQPVTPTLGPVNQYCLPMKKFSGFKDTVEICKVDPVALATIANTRGK